MRVADSKACAGSAEADKEEEEEAAEEEEEDEEEEEAETRAPAVAAVDTRATEASVASSTSALNTPHNCPAACAPTPAPERSGPKVSQTREQRVLQ